MQAESLLLTHPGKRWAEDSETQFLHHFWQLLCHGDTKMKIYACESMKTYL